MQRASAACAIRSSASRRASSPRRTRRCWPTSAPARELPQDQRIAALDASTSIDALYANTKLLRSRRASEDVRRERRTSSTPATTRWSTSASRWPPRSTRCVERKDRWEGPCSRLRPEWRRAVLAHAGKPVAPDAEQHAARLVRAREGLRAARRRLLHAADDAARASSTSTPTPSRSTCRRRVLAAAAAGKLGRWKTPGSATCR